MSDVDQILTSAIDDIVAHSMLAAMHAIFELHRRAGVALAIIGAGAFAVQVATIAWPARTLGPALIFSLGLMSMGTAFHVSGWAGYAAIHVARLPARAYWAVLARIGLIGLASLTLLCTLVGDVATVNSWVENILYPVLALGGIASLGVCVITPGVRCAIRPRRPQST